jgi:hypothetical protein
MSRAKEREKGIPFVRIPSEWLWGRFPDYLSLSVPARMVYFCLRAAYYPRSKSGPGNNGAIAESYSSLKKGSGFSSYTTISNALKELQTKGWIRKTAQGGLLKNPNKFELTGKYDPFVEGRGLPPAL